MIRDYCYYCLYELLIWYSNTHPAVRLQPWYRNAIGQCRDGWIAIKTKMTMDAVDKHIASLDIGPSGVPDPVFTEKPSMVEGLPEMRLSAPWSILTEKSEVDT